MKCTNCNAELEAGSKFCGFCGTPVAVAGPVYEAPAASVAPEVTVAPAAPATPVAPEVAAAPATPVTPEVAAAPATPVTPEVAEAPAAPTQFVQEQPAPAQQYVQEQPAPAQQYVQEQPAPAQQYVQEQYAPAQQYAQQPAPAQQYAQQPAPAQQYAQQPAPAQQQYAPQYQYQQPGQYAQQAPMAPKKKLSGKAKGMIIGGGIVAVLAIAAVVVWIMLGNKPVTKIKDAFVKTFESDGLLEQLDIEDIVEDGSFTSNIALSTKFGASVNKVEGIDVDNFNIGEIKLSMVEDEEGRFRLDLTNDDFLKKTIGLSCYVDKDKLMIGLPGITDQTVGIKFGSLNSGYLNELVGNDVIKMFTDSLSALSGKEYQDAAVKVGEEIVDAFWEVLEENGIEELGKEELSDDEKTGYRITITGQTILDMIRKMLPSIKEFFASSGMNDLFNDLVSPLGAGSFDINALLDDALVQAEREFGLQSSDDENATVMLTLGDDGAIRRLTIYDGYSCVVRADIQGGDYPLQNFTLDIAGLYLTGAGSTDKNGNEIGKLTFGSGWSEDAILWTYNKNTNEFTMKIGDNSGFSYGIGTFHFDDIEDVDCVDIRGTVEKSSGKLDLNISKLTLYDEADEMFTLSGTISLEKGGSATPLEESNFFDFGSASKSEIDNFATTLSESLLSGLLGSTVSDLYDSYMRNRAYEALDNFMSNPEKYINNEDYSDYDYDEYPDYYDYGDELYDSFSSLF